MVDVDVTKVNQNDLALVPGLVYISTCCTICTVLLCEHSNFQY